MTRASLVRLSPLLLALALVVTGVVVWRAAPFGPTEEPGSVRTLATPAYGTTYDVMLPSGRLEVVVGPRTSSLPGQLVDGSSRTDDLQAGRGDSLLPVSWELDMQAAAVAEDQRKPFTIEVVSGGERYDLGAPDEIDEVDPFASGQVAVTVAGDADPEHTVVEVGYDGHVQAIDLASEEIEPGAAAGLYEPRRFDAADRCGQRVPAGSGFTPTFVGCDVGAVTLVPYRPDLGWVDGPDEAWAVVSVELSAPYLDRVTANGSLSYDKPGEGTVQRVLLDGAEPDRGELVNRDPLDASADAELVFRVSEPPEVLRVERDLRLRAGFADDEPTHRVRLVQDLRLEPS